MGRSDSTFKMLPLGKESWQAAAGIRGPLFEKSGKLDCHEFLGYPQSTSVLRFIQYLDLVCILFIEIKLCTSSSSGPPKKSPLESVASTQRNHDDLQRFSPQTWEDTA